jgi:hypothetical protein
MKFSEWFDPDNQEHLQAYRKLQDEGIWPHWFTKPKDVELESTWQILIAFKMANRWIDFKLKGGTE